MSRAHPPTPVPQWFVALPILAIAIWWPWDPYWHSDDFIALHYAHDLDRALRDFTGPQFGATDLWWFYRPLVTLSFWIEQTIAGADPFLSHASNVVAHGINALLVGLLWRRFIPDVEAFLAGLMWAMMPSHAGSIAWAVGRVDSHATVWCLLALWLFTLHDEAVSQDKPGAAWPMVVAFAAALCTKESAMVVPLLAAMYAFMRTAPRPLGTRISLALRRSLPLFVLLLLYLPFRFYVLGRFGGYSGFQWDPLAMLTGLGRVIADLLVPLRWIGLADASSLVSLPPLVCLWVAVLPFLAAVWVLVSTPKWLAAFAFFLVALVPMAGLLAAADNPQNLRIYYLPTAVLVGLLAAPGRVSVLVLLAWAVPLIAMRNEQHRVDVQSAAMHKPLVREGNEGAPGPMFVQGLPHVNAIGTSIQFHFGVDRMLQAPFGRGGQRLLALRPLAEGRDVFQLETSEGMPFRLPLGSTWFFLASTTPGSMALGQPPAGPTLPELEVTGDVDGVLDLTSTRLRALELESAGIWERDEPSFGLQTPGVRPRARDANALAGYRITVFTANGYLCLSCPDHAAAGSTDGAIDMLRFFAGHPQKLKPARYGLAPFCFVGDLLLVPTTIDLVPEFPVLVEAGSWQGVWFTASHRAPRLVTFRFDRDYPAWLRRAQGADR
ncbi:MAG TPA: hypothetical protein VFT55_06615 [Planctomycetota bacterium]|nr:hypothetical protein [Planctomycetota bacterium]